MIRSDRGFRRFHALVVGVIIIVILAQGFFAVGCMRKGGKPLFPQWGFACLKSDLLLPMGQP